jgi:hypothetical protein
MHIGWPETVLKLGAMIISKNMLLPFGVMAFALLCAYRMDSKDLREILEKLLDQRWFAVLGWVLFVGTVYVSIRIVRWQASIYRERIVEMNRGQLPPPQEQFLLMGQTPPKK